jgi:hypothetical protein
MNTMNDTSTLFLQEQPLLQIHQRGTLTVVSLREIEPGESVNWDAAIADVVALIEETHCHRLAFDMSDFDAPSNDFLQLLVVPYRHGIGVTLYNPAPHLVEKLRTTQLLPFFTIFPEVDGMGE